MAESKAEGKPVLERKLSRKGSGNEDEEVFYADEKGGDKISVEDLPRVSVTEIGIGPRGVCPVGAPLSLDIKFELDRDVVAGYWVVKFLVDSAYNRIIKTLGETRVEDFPDGESDVHFETDSVDIGGIPHSALTNSGLLMAVFMANGEEVATVNMVVQVFEKDGEIVREILNPLD